MLFKTLNTILGPSITKQNTQTNAKIDTLDAPDDEVTFGIVHSLNILKALLASYNRFFLQKIIEKEENSILLTLHHPALLTSKCTRMMVKLQF